MSDENLCELERRWKETGAVEDEAAFLLERVRVGELTQDRLELGACFGCQAASTALGRGPVVLSVLDGLPACSAEAAVRVAVAAARVALPHWLDKHQASPLARQAEEAIELVERWVMCPCEQHSRACLDSVASSMPHWWSRLGELPEHPDRVARVVSSAIRSSTEHLPDPSSSVCAAIHSEVLPWILGYWDPLAERRSR